MDGFTYTNIFDTKGIEYIIIICFFLLLIPFWIFLNKPKQVFNISVESLGVLTEKILKIPQGLFFSKNHTWAHLEPEGSARVGLNDLLLHITGPVEVNLLRNPGQKISKGSALAVITQNGKQLQINSPITGQIESMNSFLVENSKVINNDPYKKGWMYKIKPDNWVDETNSCFLANIASQWMADELKRFKDFVAVNMNTSNSESSKLVLQEGGELFDNPLSEMPDEVWKNFQTQFLD